MEELKEELKPVNQENIRNPDGTFAKGVSGNPAGRPKGQTLKEYQAEKFRSMTPEEKEEWLSDVSKAEKWRMAEGNPKQDAELAGEVKMINVVVPAPVAKAFEINGTHTETNGSNPQ